MATVEKKPAQDEKQQQNGEVDTAAAGLRAARDRRAGLALLPRALPGPEGHPGLGARVRRADRPPGRARVGREGGVPLAGRAGGGQDRALRLRVDRAVLGRPVRAHLPDRQRGALLGRRRDRHVDLRHDAGGRGHLRLGHARAAGRVGAAVLRRRERRQGRRLLRLRARRRLGRLGLPHHRQVRRGQGRVGDQRPEGVGDQRRHRQRPRGDRLGRSRAGLARPRRLRHSPGHQGPRAGRQGEEARHPRLATPPTSTWTTAASPAPACSAARRSSTSGSPRRARARAPRARPRCGPSSSRVRRSARRRSASLAPPTSTRSTTPRSARRSAARSSRTRRSPSPSPT